MNKIILLLIPVLLFSCKKDDNTPKIETITKGSKWNLQIGSSYSEVYAQLQQLGTEKGFQDVAVIKQQPVTKPEDLQNRFIYYSAITVETTTGTLERAVIFMGQDKITSVQVGGALPEETTKWPANVSDDIAIHKNDPLNTIYNKLLAIYQLPEYKDNYKIVLSDKPLNKSFDPNMVNYQEWAFVFSVAVDKPGRAGRSGVRLYFENGKLDKIQHTYDEMDVVYN